MGSHQLQNAPFILKKSQASNLTWASLLVWGVRGRDMRNARHRGGLQGAQHMESTEAEGLDEGQSRRDGGEQGTVVNTCMEREPDKSPEVSG